jgi:type II secretory pathway component GspD/PulD (secretin)
MRTIRRLTIAAGLAALALGMPGAVHAQVPVSQVSLDLRDAPLRTALEQLFRESGLQFGIDNAVQGFVTLRIQDQPLDNALKLLLRASTVPLTYTVENGVYLVKPRVVAPVTTLVSAPAPEPVARATRFETIELSHLDPADLAQLLKFNATIQYFTRMRGQQGQGVGRIGGTGQGPGGTVLGTAGGVVTGGGAGGR